MSEVNFGDFTMENVFGDAINNTLSGVSPAHKINVNLENTNCALGAFMILEYDNIKPRYDMSDINDDTIIYIDTQTIIERSMMLAGAHAAINQSKVSNIKFKNPTDTVLSCLQGIKPARYIDFIEKLSIREYIKDGDPDILYHLNDMCEKIWFLPFTEINRILDLMQKDINKLSEEKKNE